MQLLMTSIKRDVRKKKIFLHKKEGHLLPKKFMSNMRRL